jgi:hypothetical protein
LLIFIRREHTDREEKHFKIVRFELQGRVQLLQGAGVAPSGAIIVVPSKNAIEHRWCQSVLLRKILHCFVEMSGIRQHDTVIVILQDAAESKKKDHFFDRVES